MHLKTVLAAFISVVAAAGTVSRTEAANNSTGPDLSIFKSIKVPHNFTKDEMASVNLIIKDLLQVVSAANSTIAKASSDSEKQVFYNEVWPFLKCAYGKKNKTVTATPSGADQKKSTSIVSSVVSVSLTPSGSIQTSTTTAVSAVTGSIIPTTGAVPKQTP